MKGNIKKIVADILIYIIGAFIYSLAITIFITPNQISPGGITGVATALSFISKVPSGILYFIINLPILLLGFLKFGGVFILKTAVASSIVSLSLTFTDLFLPEFTADRLLAALFGGIMMGAGMSIILIHGATTGGADIIAKLVNRKYRHLTVGRIILLIDVFVIFLAVAVYKNIDSALYSAITVYGTSFVLDRMLYGADKGKLAHIITNSPTEICNSIAHDLGRGTTVISAKGGYTGSDRTLLLCTLRVYEVATLYSIIDKYDPDAFIVMSEVGEIIGEGFKSLK